MRTPTTQEVKIIVEWLKAAGVAPKDEATMQVMVDELDKLKAPITLANLDGMAKVHRDKLRWAPLPTPDNYEDVVNQWLKTLSPSLLINSGYLSDDMATRVRTVMETSYRNHFTQDNLNGALAVVREQMFPTAAPPPPPAPKPVVRGSREDVLASVGVQAVTGRVNHAHESEPTFTKAEMAKVYEAKELEAKTWVDEIFVHPPGMTTVGGRVDHGLVDLVRNSIRAIVQDERNYKAQHPEDPAMWGRIKNRVIDYLRTDPNLPISVSQNLNRSVQ